MNESKIVLFVLFAIAYCLYSVKNANFGWFSNGNSDSNVKTTSETQTLPEQILQVPAIVVKSVQETKIDQNAKSKNIPLFIKDACSVLEIFTVKPTIMNKHTNKKIQDMDSTGNAVTMIGITVFLVILALNALLDVLKVKEEERERRKLNPNEERRQSLAEFANKRTLRRESSKFSIQLFQIAESFVSKDEEKKKPRTAKTYTRGDSINSYLSDRKSQVEVPTPTSINENSSESKVVKRSSATKLFGARSARMVRRSSFPALPLNPEVQALMLGHRQPSFDSDDESDGRGRRVRIIRRF